MPTYLLTGVDGHLSSLAATYALTLAQPTDTLIFTSPRPAFIPSSLLTACAAATAAAAAAAARKKQHNNSVTSSTGPAAIRILMVNYNDPANLARAFSGADVVAFVSSPNYLAGAARRAQHRNVVEAARRAGVGRIVYTSLVGAAALGEVDDKVEEEEEDATATATATAADTASALRLLGATDHAYTERLVRESGMEWNIQRNGLFVDSLLLRGGRGGKRRRGEWNGHAAFVAREDCGRVLGALLMGRGERNRVYTVRGPVQSGKTADGSQGGERGDTALLSSPPASPVSVGGEGEGEGEKEASQYSKREPGVMGTSPAVKGHGRRLSAGASRHGDFFGRYGHVDAKAGLGEREEEEEEEEEEGEALVLYGRYISSKLEHLLAGEDADTVLELTGREPMPLFPGEMLASPISPATVSASERRDEEDKFTRELCCG